jgi:hypothetical protein
MDLILTLGTALVGALLGACLGGRAAAAAATRQVERAQAAREARTLLNLFQALEAELSQTWERYQHLVGQDLEEADDPGAIPLAAAFAVFPGDFAVYDASARLLGALDPASAREIISTFVQFRSFLKEWQAFQRLTDLQRQACLQANVNPYEVRSLRGDVEGYFRYLRKRHLQVKGLVSASLDRLREFTTLACQRQTAVTIRL